MTIADTINRMIEIIVTSMDITSASPGHINHVSLLKDLDHPDLEGELREAILEELEANKSESNTGVQKNQGDVSLSAAEEIKSEQEKTRKRLEKNENRLEQDHSDIKQLKLDVEKTQKETLTKIEEDGNDIKQLKRDVEKTQKTSSTQLEKLGDGAQKRKAELGTVKEDIKIFKKSSLKDFTNLTSEQVSNLKGFSKDPFQFMFSNFFKKFAKGAGILALAAIIFGAVQFIIAELMKPGRTLDRRFRRVARDEIFLFNTQREQAELRQGFRTVTITTQPFLKGSQLRGQLSGNLYNPTAIPMDRLDIRRVEPPLINTRVSSRASKFANRRNSRFG